MYLVMVWIIGEVDRVECRLNQKNREVEQVGKSTISTEACNCLTLEKGNDGINVHGFDISNEFTETYLVISN